MLEEVEEYEGKNKKTSRNSQKHKNLREANKAVLQAEKNRKEALLSRSFGSKRNEAMRRKALLRKKDLSARPSTSRGVHQGRRRRRERKPRFPILQIEGTKR